MKVTKKLIPAMAMLIISAVVMSTASYAWFTMSREVTAKGMDVTVTAPNNLLIKATDADDSTYGSETDLATEGVKLFPASSVDGINLYSVNEGQPILNVATGSIDLTTTTFKDAILAVAKNTDGGYMDFNYTLKTQGGEALSVYVKSYKLLFNLTSTDSTTTTKFSMDKDGKIFAPNSETEITPEGNTITHETKTYKLPEGYKSIRFAVVHDTNESAGVINAGGGANHEAGKAISSVDGETDLGTRGTVTAVTGNTEVVNIPVNTPMPISIRVWLEGDDTTCTADKAANMNFGLEVVLAKVGA